MGSPSLIWEKVSICLISLLIGGLPGYFFLGPSKPDRTEVEKMIEIRTPLVIEGVIREIRNSNIQLGKALAVIEERLLNISKTVDGLSKGQAGGRRRQTHE